MNVKKLPDLALSILALPHSNADAERSFSILRKIERDSRGNLAQKTVKYLMNCKFNIEYNCFDFKPSRNLIVDAIYLGLLASLTWTV